MFGEQEILRRGDLMFGLSAKQMKEFTDVIDNRIRNMINPTPMMKVAKVNTVQTTICAIKRICVKLLILNYTPY